MSKASEWAARVSVATNSVNEAKSSRPDGFAFKAHPGTIHQWSVAERGEARIVTPEARNGMTPDVADAIALARWILATFGDA